MKSIVRAKTVTDAYGSDVGVSRRSKLRGRLSLRILKGLTMSAFLLWVGLLGYFLLSPLVPDFQEKLRSIRRYNPYDIGYNATTGLLVRLSPPDYSVEDAFDENDNTTGIQTIEYVDPDTVELAHLEKLKTTVSIDAAGISGKVVDGYSQESMIDGFWHYPLSAVPGTRGNTVIFGHRFQKLPPASDTFFNLDKVRVGDRVTVTMDKEIILYTVVSVKVVGKYDESILAQTNEYQLTLLTCTPLWTAQKRLAVIAIQDRVSNVI